MAGGISFSRKTSSRLVPKDSAESRDRNTQICSRVGCASKTSSTEVNHNQSPASSKQLTKSPSSSLSKPRQSRLNPCNKLDVSGEASSSSSKPRSSSPLVKKEAMYRFKNMKSNLGKKRMSEAECSVSTTRGKEISRPQLDDWRSQTLHGGISISNSTTPINDDVTSVGILRSDARATRRLNEQEQDVGQYNMNEIAEMLIALERIEHDEEVSYEDQQWLVLETNLILSGLSHHDQHRELRLDIDNMSYEELLALEEKMGNVSTALSEESIEKCLKKIIYHATEQQCSICQEDYNERKEVGKLRCEHFYHVECIKKWLMMKNWCPVCKASAEP